jgi:hypothetical protein
VKRPLLLALLFNLLPVACAVLFGWGLLSLMLLYWAENVIVGIINVAKMILAGMGKGASGTTAILFDVPFFIVHYGLFCAVHGVLILVLFSGEPAHAVDDPANLPFYFLRQVHIDRFFAVNLALLTMFHLYRFAFDWIAAGEWRKTTPLVQMFQPYGRIIVVHLAVFVGGFVVSLLGHPVIAVALLAFLKTALEVGAAEVETGMEAAKA